MAARKPCNPPGAVDGYIDESHVDTLLDANLLEFMLGSTGPFDLGDDYVDGLFDSFPNTSDATGVNCNAVAKVDHPDTPRCFGIYSTIEGDRLAARYFAA